MIVIGSTWLRKLMKDFLIRQELLNNVNKDLIKFMGLTQVLILWMIGLNRKLNFYSFCFKNGVQDGLKFLNKSKESKYIL
jgi:hypothetical protein